MCAGDRDVDAPNHDVTLLLGVDYGFVHAFHGRLEIDNLALAHAARWRLSHSEDFRCAVRPALADHHANLRSANFQTDHQIVTSHVNSVFLSQPEVRAEPEDAP